MTESYEVVFQQVAASDLLELLKALEMSAEMLSGLAVSEDIENIVLAGIDKELVDAVISYEGDVCLTGQLHGFKAPRGVRLPFVLLRVIKYKDDIDVELSFDADSSFDDEFVMLAVQMYADELSKKYYMTDFYGGLEPAKDTDTRYFTGNVLGPLGLSKN
jgi:hypothetical protein